MKPFDFRRGDQQWTEGSLLHVYALVDAGRDPGLIELVHRSHTALADWPLTPVEAPWLHITIDQVTDRPAERITRQERDRLAQALADSLADVEPFEVVIGSLLSYPSGVIADLHPDDALTRLHQAVHATILRQRGDAAARYPWSPPHLTTAYAHGEADSDQAQRLLRRIRPSHAVLHVDAVHVVDVTADQEAKAITWDHVAAIPLGGTTAPSIPR